MFRRANSGAVRCWYGLIVCGYVVMPEHVHLLVSEPERGTLAAALQILKQTTARRLRPDAASPLWQARYYDFNVGTDRKRIEKLRYMHRNPVKRGLAARPEDWPWSSFLHYATGVESTVEIASEWTAQRQERGGIGPPSLSPYCGDKGGAPGEGSRDRVRGCVGPTLSPYCGDKSGAPGV